MLSNAPAQTLLSLISPVRVVLIGPADVTLALAAQWAGREPGVTLLRQADAEGHGPGDLLACAEAAQLPVLSSEPALDRSAMVPLAEQARAVERGWATIARSTDGFALLRPAALATPPLEPRLDTYVRSRRALSDELQTLAGASRPAASLAIGPLRASTPAPAPARQSEPPMAVRNRRGVERVAIVVPIHNAAGALRRCIAALAQHTTWPSELWLIDDASTDPEIEPILAEAAALDGVRILRNAVNLGFTATANRALRATDGDVVLLNSDTEVGPRWLEHLVATACARPDAATVTPVSDNAGAFSVPDSGLGNVSPIALGTADTARRLAQAITLPPPVAPTGNGFCLYIKRAALEALGGFDEEGFPRGYGEENDFCMRAVRAGWTHLVDGRTFVAHQRQGSFMGEREQLAGPARARIDQRYPEYTELVRAFAGGEPMAELRAQVRAAYREPAPPRPRLLFVIHEGGGGTWIANLELMRALAGVWEPFMLTSDRRTLKLWRLEHGELINVREWTLERRLQASDFSRQDYRSVVSSILTEYEFELVHVRHLFKHTFDLPEVAATLGVPVVLSFHDFYFVCPTVHLLDDHDHYCAGECTAGDGTCRMPDAGLGGLPHLKHSYVHQWREEAAAMLRHVDAFVTTSRHARDVHRRALPSLGRRRFELIEHGRSLRQRGGIAVAPQPGAQVRILVVANLDVHKGVDYIRALRACPSGERLEFHLLGAVPDVYADLGVCHGSFVPGQLPEHAARIGPSFVGCFSIFAETYSHAVTEAWAMGVPVLATDIGALGERLRAHGGGELLPVDDPEGAVRRICRVADDEAEYATLRRQASLRGCAGAEAMADAYSELYRTVTDDRRPFAAPAGSKAPAAMVRGVRRMLAVVDGADGRHPGSAFVRVIQRYRHPGVDWKLSLRLRCPEDDPVRPGTDLVLLQRTALAPGRTESFVTALAQREIPLVLDLDDHLLLKGPHDAEYGAHQEGLRLVLDAAQLVLVPHERLARALEQHTGQIAVVPNLIDERLFLAGTERRPRGADRGSRPLQIVYLGSPTHARDLELLRPALTALARERPGQFVLNVIGGEPPGLGQDWYRRLVVPDECKPYPQFVPWLRSQRPAWDIAVAPLHDEEFNRYKSDLKYLEYSALGLPGIYSDCEPYADVRDRVTGLKADDRAAAWIDALSTLADDPALCDALAEAAFTEVTSERLLRHGAPELLRIMCELAPDVEAELFETGS